MRFLTGRHLLAALLFGMALYYSRPVQAAAPNVLLIVTDDQGYGDLSCTGNPYLKTPHIDRLAHEGIRFERFYVNSFCAPTRGALLTGRYPVRAGVWGVTHNKECLRDSEVTLGEAFLADGYRTALFGKWHNGEQYPHTPTGQGFQEFLGFNNGHINNYFDAELIRGTQRISTSGYITDVLTDAALEFVTREAQQPFFCLLSYNAPHSPYQVPDAEYDRFRAMGLSETLSGFYGMCENIDGNVGRLLAELERTGRRENTIILFLTDNGGTAGVKTYNAGMRGGKTSVHEGGCRVPLFIHWPRRYPQPQVVERITSHIDLFPTLLELCGLSAAAGPPLDGVSLVPLMDNPQADWPDRILMTHNPISESNRYPGAVRTEQFRLVREIPSPQGGSSAVDRDPEAGPWQLYDMQSDPGENRDLAREHPEIVRQLSQEYETWIDSCRHPPLTRLPLPVGYREHNPIVLHAPQAFFKGDQRFANGSGFAHDWLTDWNEPGESVWFEIDVQQAGSYRAGFRYASPNGQAEDVVRLISAAGTATRALPAGEAAEIPLPHRDARSAERFRNRVWCEVDLGRLELSTGPQTLHLQIELASRERVVDFKELELEWLSP